MTWTAFNAGYRREHGRRRQLPLGSVGTVRTVEVRAGQHSYEVLIGAGLLEDIGSFVRRKLHGQRCAILADEHVVPLFGNVVLESLREAGFNAELLAIPAGEEAKSMAQAAALCEKLSALGLDRSSFLVSLGGGVVGDLVGFVASIYFRGIPYVSIPTTLLAQIDSCIGGKTGVNSSAGKNLIGAFHHPALVIADTDTLRSLPDRIWHEGFAEAIKHGIIRDAELFDSLPADGNDARPELADGVHRTQPRDQSCDRGGGRTRAD